MSPQEREALRQHVAAERRSQGLPEHIEDPAVIAQVVRILRATTRAA